MRVVKPRIGERIYDGAVGSAEFLCEAFDYLSAKPGLTTKDAKTLQERTLYGKEKKSLAYVAIMNMILHGIEAPNIPSPLHQDDQGGWRQVLLPVNDDTMPIVVETSFSHLRAEIVSLLPATTDACFRPLSVDFAACMRRWQERLAICCM